MRFIGAMAALALAWPPSPASAREAAQRVLMLHAYNFTHPATTLVSNAARQRLLDGSATKPLIDGDFLDLARIDDTGHEQRTASFLREKYARTPPDLVMTIGGEALPFALKHRDVFAPGVPIVFTSVSQANYLASHPPPDVTGIILELDLDKTIALAERLQPDAQRLYVVAGSAAIDRRWQATARKAVESRPKKYETHYLFELPYERLVAEVSRVPRDAIVVALTVFVDGTGETFVPADVMTALARVSPAPVYSPYGTNLGTGVVGGYSETFESVGVAAADLALEILAGQDPATLPPRASPGLAYRVDYKALRRWGLSENDLPPGTILISKEPGVWDRHRDFVILVLSIIALLSGFVIALLVQRHRRQVAEAEAAVQRQQVAHLMRVSVLGELSGSIAHEINQPLTAILSNAHAALDMVPAGEPGFVELRDTLNDIVRENNRASEVITRLRNLLTKNTRSIEAVHINDVVGSTVDLLRGELSRRMITVSTDLAAGLPATSGDAVQIQQVLLNLIMNAMDAMASTPAAQRQITVTTRVSAQGMIELLVQDRGSGIPAACQAQVFEPFYTTKEHGLGLGLTICRTIAQAHGGTLTLANADAAGLVARLCLPASALRRDA